MIGVLALFWLAAPAYADLEPFMDEPSAARAFEAHIGCLGGAAFDRRDDRREIEIIAAEIIGTCAEQGRRLRTALIDVYREKPGLIGSGADAGEAADHYLGGARARVEDAIREFRSRGK